MKVDAARRFGGMDRLYGDGSRERLAGLHAMVIGIGGVGSWAVEALARSGVGIITLVDLDHVAESNINRQIHASDATLGMAKVQAMAQRIASFAPDCQVRCVEAFIEPDTAVATLEALLPGVHAVLDCCDQVRAKVQIAALCARRGVDVVVAGAAGGKTEPWRLQLADLSVTEMDPLLSKMRYQLRRQHGFPREPGKRFKIQAVYSTEPVRASEVCDAAAGLNCAGYGSVVTVTATMGMHMAAWVLQRWLAHARVEKNKT